MPLPQRKGDKKPDRRISASHKAAPKQEARLAKAHGGRVTTGSGNQRELGDVRLPGVLRIEAKSTIHRSFSVTMEMLDKIENAAAGAGEMPAIAIDFVDPDGNVLKSCYVIPAWAMEGR